MAVASAYTRQFRAFWHWDDHGGFCQSAHNTRAEAEARFSSKELACAACIVVEVPTGGEAARLCCSRGVPEWLDRVLMFASTQLAAAPYRVFCMSQEHKSQVYSSSHDTLDQAKAKAASLCKYGSCVLLTPHAAPLIFGPQAQLLLNYAASEIVRDAFGLGKRVQNHANSPRSAFGRTLFVAADSNGKLWLSKSTCAAYSRCSLQAACAWSTKRSSDLNQQRIAALGGAEMPSYKGILLAPSRMFVFRSVTKENNTASWVCCSFIYGAADLAQSNCSLQQRRVGLARALAVVHRFGKIDLTNPMLPVPVMPKAMQAAVDNRGIWSWIGATAYRPSTTIFGQGGGWAGVDAAKRVAFTRQANAQRIDSLPLYATTGDLQTKNVVRGGFKRSPDAICVINCETLVPLSRMWDVLWLLLLDDMQSGVVGASDNEYVDINTTWVHEFAAAVCVYTFLVGRPFTAEESSLFVSMAQIKIHSIGSSFATFRPNIVRAERILHTNKDIIEHIMQSAERVYSPIPHLKTGFPLGYCGDAFMSRIPFPIIEAGIKVAIRSGKRPILLHFNGTFAPVHLGHLEAAVAVAAAAEKSLGGVVVGILFSPSNVRRVMEKLDHENATLFTNLTRTALLNIAIVSHEAERLGLPRFRPFVDTFELHHCNPSELHRIKAVALHRLISSCPQPYPLHLAPLLCCVAGSDVFPGVVNAYLAMHPQICVGIHRRPGYSSQELETVLTRGAGNSGRVFFAGSTQSSAVATDKANPFQFTAATRKSATVIREALKKGGIDELVSAVGIDSVAASLASYSSYSK